MQIDESIKQHIAVLFAGMTRLHGLLVTACRRPESDEVGTMAIRLRQIASGDSSDPRPEDPAELARLTAEALHQRGISADWRDWTVGAVLVPCHDATGLSESTYLMTRSEFDNLGPIGVANEIQAQEADRLAKWRAQQRNWAGDEVERVAEERCRKAGGK